VRDLFGKAPAPFSALCLSGGGIRSATFSLGVIQSLARRRLLSKFDYLSTVSGGGYIGSWLSAWASRVGIDAVEVAISPGRTKRPVLETEAKELRFLRDYSNYLTPKLGLMSADTWAAVATYARNLFLIWLTVMPFLVGILAIPSLCVQVTRWRVDTWPAWTVRLWIGSFALATIATGVLSATQLAWRRIGDRKTDPRRMFTQTGHILALLFPLVLSGVALAVAWAWMAALSRTSIEWGWFGLVGACYPVATIVRIVVWLIRPPSDQDPGSEPKTQEERWRGRRRAVWVFSAMFAAAAAAGLAVGFLAWLVAHPLAGMPDSMPGLYVCVAVPTYLSLHFVGSAIFVGLASQISSRMDEEIREWWARFQGWMLAIAVSWLVFSLIALFGAWALRQLGAAISAVITVGSVGGMIALLNSLGSDVESAKPSAAARLLGLAKRLVGPLFVIVLMSGLAYLGEALIEFTTAQAMPIPAVGDVTEQTSPWGQGLLTSAGTVAGLLVFSFVIGLFVNANKFSMQAFYRNRLTRAYLGAVRVAEREPHPFTGFDAEDNLFMKDLGVPHPADGTKELKAPLHIINLALNLVHGKRLAWQERRAESFTVSRLSCGSSSIIRTDRESRVDTCGAYRASEYYGGRDGITLGAAMAISGAAVSPNMGYHTSPVLSFLLTIFNARLGAWLGNPARWQYRRTAPLSSLVTILAEAFGFTDDKSAYVYLSDGGHFENLGLYEMVLRRCRTVVVIDAGCDPKAAYDDLGNAIRKIRIDFGIGIDLISKIPVRVRTPRGERGIYCAVGTIRYGDADGEGAASGTLIYVKPVFDDDEPADIRNYADTHERFPHESTADQFFSESQFESYRALGQHIADALTDTSTSANVEDFVEDIKAQLGMLDNAPMECPLAGL
jgi:hypothetical protein